MIIPHPDSIIGLEGQNLTYEYSLSQIGKLDFYVKCQDVNGNKNVKPYLIDICIKPGPDLTAPKISRTLPSSGSYIAYGEKEKQVIFYVNEPADCKYSSEDKSYENMESTMTCFNGLQEASIFGWKCLANLNLEQEKFYVRCKDQPWLTGEEAEKRNTNQQSFIYELKKSVSELKIDKIEPEGDITSGVEPTSITLRAETSGGAENGKAVCEWEIGKWKDKFFNTNSNIHNSELTSMTRGSYTLKVKCEDIAGNVAESEGNFKLRIDTTPPRVIRAYNAGVLKIITDEDSECVFLDKNCNYIFENATKMSGILREHEADWQEGSTYFIKCKDLWDNKPGGCSIIVKAV